MLRLTRFIASIKTPFTTTPLLFKSSSLVFRHFAFFSEAPKHRVFELIENSDLEKNIGKVAQELTSLQDQLRDQALQMILEKIFNGKLPAKIVQNSELGSQLKRNHSMYFDFCYFRVAHGIAKLNYFIDGQDKSIKKTLAKEISDLFIACFDTVKKIEEKSVTMKELHLLRTFARYNINSLIKLVNQSNQQEVINKSRESYKLVLTKISSLLKMNEEEISKLEEQAESISTSDLRQSKQKQLQQLEQYKFQLVQEYSEAINEMIAMENQLEKNEKNENEESNRKQRQEEEVNQQFQFVYSKQALALQPLIEQAIKNYDMVSNKNVKSRYLYTLKKVILELRHQKKVSGLLFSRIPEKEKQQHFQKLKAQLKSNLDQLYEKAVQDLQHNSFKNLQAEELSDFIMNMLSFQLHKFDTDIQADQNKLITSQLAEQVQKLISHIPNQILRKKTLVLVIKQVKQIFGVKIQNLVEKVPRNLRNSRRNRTKYEQ